MTLALVASRDLCDLNPRNKMFPVAINVTK